MNTAIIYNSATKMLSRFWSDSFWLPANVTWEDISNGPGKDKTYAEVKDYWVQIPLVFICLTLRFLSEKYVFGPLGRYLNIRDVRVRKAAPNVRLEAEYRKSLECKNALYLAKQLDLTERQIEHWWRLRRNQNKLSTLAKFCECMWKGIFSLINVSIGIYVAWGKGWVQDLDKCFDGYPFQGITPDIWWLYMLVSAGYITLVITQFYDARRKDFWQMFIHHITVFCLLYFSWAIQCFRIGCLILILHEIVDVLLHFGKAAKYARFQRIVNCLFAVFVCVWVATRLVLYPFYILPTLDKYYHLSRVGMLMHMLLLLLLALSLIWTWLIFKLVKRTVSAGQFDNDLRSSESEDNDQTNSCATKGVSRNSIITDIPT